MMSEAQLTPFMMTPVFCAADIPSKTIDLLLIRAAYRAKEINTGDSPLYIVTSRDRAPLETAQPTTAPVVSNADPSRSNPFIGLGLQALRAEYLRLFGARVAPSGTRFTHLTFVVLDARSVKDETCLLVSCSFDEGEARSDFFLPVEVLTATEMGSCELNEGMEVHEWADPKVEGLYFYEVEKWNKYVKY